MQSSGRRSDGNFALTSFRIDQATSADQSEFQPVPLTRALSDDPQRQAAIAQVLDDDDATYWDILPHIQRRHSAIFAPAAPVAVVQENLWRFRLEFKAGPDLALGRFRFSVTDDPAALEKEELRSAAQQVDDPWLRLALAYDLRGQTEAAVPLFAIALQHADAFDARRTIIEIAARSDDVFAALSRQLPDDPQLQLAWARRLYDRGREHLAQKDRAQANLDLQKAHEIFIRLRTQRSEGNWSVLTPIDLRSPGGEKFAVEADGGIFVSGANSDHPIYTLRMRTTLPSVSGLLLETIPDARLPEGGAGRADNGNFHVAEVTAAISGGQSIPIISAAADPNWLEGNGPDNLIDRNRQTRWDAYPKMKSPHWAAFEFNAPVETTGKELTIRIDAGVFDYKKHGLGRFRLSATNRSDAFRLARIRQQVEESEVLKVIVALAATIADSDETDEALRPLVSAYEEAGDFAARRRIVEAVSEFEDVLAALARRFPEDVQLCAFRAHRLSARGKDRLARGRHAEALADLEESLEAFRKTFSNQGRILPAPLEMKADSGVQLELLSDGSVFARQSGAAQTENYTLTFDVDSPAIRALRLDALADSRLPGGGPGWADNGNFVLSEMKLFVSSAGDPGPPREISLRNADADFSQTTNGFYDARWIIDGDSNSGWAVHPQVNRNHSAVVELAEPIAAGRKRITVWLSQQFREKHSHLGRFRVSFSENPFEPGWQLAPDCGELADLGIAIAKARTQLNQRDEAIAALVAALDRNDNSDQTDEVIALAATIDGGLEKLTATFASSPQLFAGLARHYSRVGKTPLAEAAKNTARVLWEKQIETEPGNSLAARELANHLVPRFDTGSNWLVSTAEVESLTWRYTTELPPTNWMHESFDDSGWQAGPGAFGDHSPPGVSVRTSWKSNDIWLRRTFERKSAAAFQSLLIRLLHDDDCELFVNGREIYRREGYAAVYQNHLLDGDVLKAFRSGTNTVAVHCHSDKGSQYVDVGLLEVPMGLALAEKSMDLSKIADPWARLAAAYDVVGEPERVDKLFAAHSRIALSLADLFAARQDWDRAVVGWRQLVIEQPDRLQGIYDRLKNAHRWNDAAEFGLLLIQQTPTNSITWLQNSPILALADDQAAYADFCRRMAAQFADSKVPEDSERVVKSSLLRPGAVELAKLPADAFCKVIDDGTVHEGFLSWGWGTRALLALRQGDAKFAVACVAKSEGANAGSQMHALNLVVLAMAHHRLKNPEESRRALEEARQLIRDLQAQAEIATGHDTLIPRILLNEAETLLDQK
jgi:tetratricopeptide (TPR) repeat protein